jgi:hypothetical protein
MLTWRYVLRVLRLSQDYGHPRGGELAHESNAFTGDGADEAEPRPRRRRGGLIRRRYVLNRRTGQLRREA